MTSGLVNGTRVELHSNLKDPQPFHRDCETVLSVIASAFTEISPFVGKYGAAFGREVAVESGGNLSLPCNFVVHNDDRGPRVSPRVVRVERMKRIIITRRWCLWQGENLIRAKN